MQTLENDKTKIEYEPRNGLLMIRQFRRVGNRWDKWGVVMVPLEFLRHLTPLALDTALPSDNEAALRK